MVGYDFESPKEGGGKAIALESDCVWPVGDLGTCSLQRRFEANFRIAFGPLSWFWTKALRHV